MTRTIKVGPFPDALLLNDTATGPWDVPLPQQLMAMPLDKPSHHARDEIVLRIRQRTTDSSVVVTLDLTRVVSVVRWLERSESFESGEILGLPGTGLAQQPGEEPSINLLALARKSATELLVGVEHWTSGVRNHREVLLTDGQIGELTEWLHRYWVDGLPGMPRRRADESATDFAERRTRDIADYLRK